ncbi:RagB/SusD family nutrient uptake outer membrane protein [Flavobacterium microcysteis]|uniref:RagB/SusD family nutrient uptake outer membrane protein n=1 Tax=Flavobacterium microcysteis TaxID=2596891 RepID=A0A501PZA4_9FLAO|nr:RagB/SusD family nutrient uptake outer membrane protein [Flavobacterium microcysteis]TPD65763.1 RagB/SusD family nutrient uptake outer membrane protein [Flavobacterium microcysteis]
MKKSILLLPIFFLMLFSCSDAYDIRQDNEVEDPEAFTTIAHLASGLNGAYAAYGPDFGGDAIIFNDLFTDNIRKGKSNNGQGSEEYNFLMQPNSDMPESVWGNRYATINRVNRVLRAYDRLYDGFTDPEKRRANQIKGHLLALRALCHFDLFQYFTVDYKNAASPCVIKMDFVPASTFDVFPRNTVGEITDFIKQDLTEGRALIVQALTPLFTGETIPAELTAYNTVMYLRPVAIDFISCKLALLQGDYPTAQSIANTILTTPGNALASRTIYAQMFGTTDAAGESAFKLSRVLRNNQVTSLFYFNYDSNGRAIDPLFYGSLQLYNLFTAADIRRTVIFGGSNDIGRGELPITKYPGSNDGAGINDIKLFRFAELKLILAECKARNNDLLGAATDVQQLRAQRLTGANPVPTYANLNAALTDILNERRKEFAFEGHRYLDLKRIGNEINVGISRLADDAFSFSAPTSLPASDYRFTLPIPRSEISANPTIAQNPNY